MSSMVFLLLMKRSKFSLTCSSRATQVLSPCVPASTMWRRDMRRAQHGAACRVVKHYRTHAWEQILAQHKRVHKGSWRTDSPAP